MPKHIRKPGFFRSSALLLLLALSPTASAASIYLTQTGGPALVQTGDSLVFELIIDFTDEATLGGGFDIEWDPTALSFEELIFYPVGDPSFGRPPDITDDALYSWGFGAFDGIFGVHVLGTIEFSVLATMGPTTTIDFACESSLQSCLFLSSDDFITKIQTDLVSTEISRVPVPGAVWLFASALAAVRFAHAKK